MAPLEEKDDLILLLESGPDAAVLSFIRLLHKDDLLEALRQLPSHHWQRLAEHLHPSDVADLLTELPSDQWKPFMETVELEFLADILVELEDPEIRKAIQHIDRHDLAELLTDMESDDATDILGEMTQKEVREVLSEMSREDAAEIKELLKYPEDCAGGLMQTELVRVPLKSTVLEAVYEIQRQHEEEEGELEIHAVYVVDSQGMLKGQLSLERIILSKAEEMVSDLIAGEEVFWIDVHADQEEVADYFRRYDLISAPVLDQEHRLLGRITADDIMDVIAEEASEDILQMAGAAGEDMVYDRILHSATLRLPWLLTNLLGGLITGYLTWMFTKNLSEILVLVTFVPVITGMGGNVGTQSSSITVRGFAIGRIGLSNIGKFFLKEMRVGALMGIICGIGLTIIGIVWLHKPYIGLVVGLALFLAMTLAASMGSLFPALFQRLGIDPALASGPFVTTFNDVMGILIYYSTAMMFRSLLVPVT